MSDHAHSHSPKKYIKIWGILLILLIVSILGPELGNRVITLITAFGIAIVKALMVAAYFMHLNTEKRYIWYLMITVLGFMGILFFGVASDIMNDKGTNWKNPAPPHLLEEAKERKANH